VFDLYIDRGVSQYLQLRAEFELGLGPEPSMAAVMGRAERLGLVGATTWAVVVAACGWMTILLAPGRRRSGGGEPPR
jgi:hypothetical protein